MTPDRAGLIKVIEKAQTGSPSIIADRILESDWLKQHTEAEILDVIE